MAIDINDVLNKFSSLSDSEVVHMFGEYHVQLLDESNEETIGLQGLEIFQRYYTCLNFSRSFEENSYLRPVIKRLCSYVTKSVAKADDILSSTDIRNQAVNELVSILQRNTSILSGFDDFLMYFISHDVLLKKVGSIAIDIISTLLTYFQHCRNNEHNYQKVDITLNEHVTVLFKKCQQVQNHYSEFLNKFDIDCSNENDLEILVVILEKIFDIGVAVSSLDLKTMAQVWKGFISLLKSYAPHVKTKFNVPIVMRFFCEEITKKITGLYENSDTKHQNLTLKIANFLLKITVKLCEYLTGSLEECFASLLQLFFFLYEHSQAWSRFSNINFQLIDEIDRTLLPAMEPLIETLIRDRDFASYCLHTNMKQVLSGGSQIGILLLLRNILEKLVSCEEEVQNMWLEFGVFDACLKTISDCHKMLCYGVRIPISCASPTLPQDIFLYDSLIVSMSSLIICAVSEEQFYLLEETLVEHLLRGSLLVKIFIVDLWCILDRYGSSELCLEHIRYLISLCKLIHCESVLNEILKSLLKRLFGLLSTSHQMKLIQEMDVTDALFIEFCEVLSCSGKPAVTNSAIGLAIKRINDTRNNANLSLAENIKLLGLIKVVREKDCNEEFSSWIKTFILQQWKFFDDCSLSSLSSLSEINNFVFCLCRATSNFVVSFSSVSLLNILNNLCELTKCECCFIQLNIQKVLRALAHCRADDPQVSEFCSKLGFIFRACLEDPNPIVKLSSLKTFEYFSHITTHEMVIQKTIINSPKLKEDLSMYLQKRLQKSLVITFEDFVIQLFSSTRKELPDLKPVPFEDHVPVAKKIKLNYNVLNKINEAESVFNDLKRVLSSCDDLSEDERNNLRNLIKVVEELRRFL